LFKDTLETPKKNALSKIPTHTFTQSNARSNFPKKKEEELKENRKFSF
jgi:hypothetical protein